jgi:ribosomal protein S18 acetylase RimI-like enzyme
MADVDRDPMLREMAKHRGFKLVKSRRRKPGGDFGRYGLTDAATGQDCFGIGKSGLEATGEEIEDYLRGAAKADWKRSLGNAGKLPKAKPRKASIAEPPSKPKPEPPPEPKPKPEPEPEPELVVREAKAGDADAVAALLAEAGARTSATEVAAALRELVRAGEAPFVAEERSVVGCAAYHSMPSLQHGAIGRITLLIVLSDARRRGVGTALLEAAQARLADRGCSIVEAVSDIDLANAHGFFRRHGYERTSYRFARSAVAGGPTGD